LISEDSVKSGNLDVEGLETRLFELKGISQPVCTRDENLKGNLMTINVDPENSETRAVFNLADFNGQSVLEIGCGDGRLT
jgi:hypothetical protein